MTRLRLLVPAAATALALLASGCSVVDGLRGRTETPVPTQTPPASMPGTERFYAQRLQWRSCSGGQCAQLEVPVDYAKPDGDTIKLALLRVPASSRGSRIGSLVVNPGGPGGSGVDYARAADFIVGPGVRRSYDIVGFDPRGVGRSAPIDCLSDRELDDFLGGDPTPDDAAEQETFAAGARELGRKCEANAGPLLGHVSTVDAAKDMDVLRAALGERTLTYLGKSYGTYLGATYAGLFPTLVGRFVLDGVVPPDVTAEEVNIGQAQGFDRATRAWAAYCVQQGDCPLGDTTEQVMEGLAAFLERVDRQPLPRTGDRAVTELTEGWASTGIAAAMYDDGMWSALIDALRDAQRGDGAALMEMANQYADRRPGGGYDGNIMEVIYAVNCLDKPESADLADRRAQVERAEKAAPMWGRFLAWSSLPCGTWPVESDAPDSGPRRISATGAPPIVVIGTTRDPATPYDWSVRLRDQLDRASLITFDGDGHTAYTRSNSCVDDAVDRWYLHGDLPQDGLRC